MPDISTQQAWLSMAASLATLALAAGTLIALVRVVVTKADFAEYRAQVDRDALKNEKDHRDMRHETKNDLQAQVNLMQIQIQRIEGNVTWLMRRSSERGE